MKSLSKTHHNHQSCGYGSGYGSGDGDGCGSGSGSGLGSGLVDGFPFGSGFGDGFCSGSGSGDGYGDGCGFSLGLGSDLVDGFLHLAQAMAFNFNNQISDEHYLLRRRKEMEGGMNDILFVVLGGCFLIWLTAIYFFIVF